MPTASMLRIAWVAPASPMGTQVEVEQAKQWVEARYPCRIVYTPACYQSQSIEERTDQFLQCALDPDIDGLWAVRGGEGSADLIPHLISHKDALQALPPKWLLGFSDITALLFFLSRHSHWQAIHGPCVKGFVSGRLNQPTMDSMQAWLSQQAHEVMWSDLQPLNKAATQISHLSAPMVAGNLTMVTLGVKDCWELDALGKMIVLEDVNEHPYAIARSLKYLQRVGVLQGANALILGGFSQHVNTQSPLADATTPDVLPCLRQFAKTCDYPVFISEHIGHGCDNVPVLINQVATIRSNDGCIYLSYALTR